MSFFKASVASIHLAVDNLKVHLKISAQQTVLTGMHGDHGEWGSIPAKSSSLSLAPDRSLVSNLACSKAMDWLD